MGMLLAIVVGALVGAGLQTSFGGAVIGGFIGWLIVRSLSLQRELQTLRATLTPFLATGGPSPALVPPIERAAEAAPAAAWTPVIEAAPEPLTDPLPAPVVTRAAAVPSGAEAPDAVGSEPPQVAPPATPHPWVVTVREWLFGGNTIVKAGIAILFIGLAFLARYASEHAQLAIEWRLALIGATAVVLLVIGWRLRLRRPGYAQVLQGGAVAVLYLTLFAAFRYYGVIAALPALVTMVAIAMFAAGLAVLQEARSLAVIGALGGFATPLLVSTGSDNATALFAYYFVLDAGIAAVAWFRTWRPLNLIGFVATFGVSAAWGVLRYEPAHFASSEAFLIAFFLLFVLILVLPARRLNTPAAAADPLLLHDRWVNSSLLFGLPTAGFALQYGLVRDTAYGAALSALVLAGFYVALASWMRKRPALLGLTLDASLGIATVFLTLVIPFALDARSTAGAWSLEGAALVWIGFRQRRAWPRGFGYLLLLIAAGAMLHGHQRFGTPESVFNAYLFNGLMAAAASIAAAYFVHRNAGAMPSDATRKPAYRDAALEAPLIGLATLWLLATTGLQLSIFVPSAFTLAAAIVGVSLIAALYAALAARLDWPGIALPTIAHAPLLLLAAASQALGLAQPSANGGWWAWPIGFAAHAAVLALALPRWRVVGGRTGDETHALGAITLALLGALLGRALTAGWGDAASAWPWLGWLVAPAAMLFVLPHPAAARWWPIRAAPEAYARGAGAALAAGLWIWTLVANLASDGSAAPLPHVPLLNPLDLGIAVALVATLTWLRRTTSVAPWSLALGGVAGFVWLNAVLLRAFHHYGGVPYRAEAWADSLAVQTGITLLWTVLALVAMWLAARRSARWPWIAGAALLGAVVVKLLLVDLAGSGSVMRIVSFIGVGVLMLLIGYVAPLPARKVDDATL